MDGAEHKCWTVNTTAWRPERSAPAMVAVLFQHPPKQTEHGRSISMRFPVLVVPDHVEGAQAFADRVAAILNEHWPEGED
jgi:hypothetical protein